MTINISKRESELIEELRYKKEIEVLFGTEESRLKRQKEILRIEKEWEEYIETMYNNFTNNIFEYSFNMPDGTLVDTRMGKIVLLRNRFGDYREALTEDKKIITLKRNRNYSKK